MFRFKTLSIAILLLLTGGAAFVGDTILHVRVVEKNLETELIAGRLMAERALQDMVDSNVNRAVALASDTVVLSSLRELSAGAELGASAEKILPHLSKWLEEQKASTRPAWVLVLDGQGRVVFRSEAPKEHGDSVAGIPLVQHMLRGAALDAIWELESGLCSVASAAALAGDKIVGGVLLGFKLNETTLGSLSARFSTAAAAAQVGMALTWNGSTVAKSFVLEQGTRIPSSSEPTAFGSGVTKYHPLPVLTPPRGLYLGNSQRTRGWPERLLLTVTVPHAKAYEHLAERQFVIGVASLLLLLLSLAWGSSIYRAVNKPLNIIVEHLSGVQRGSNVGLLPEVALRAPYLRLGKLVNMLISSRSGPVRTTAPGKGDDISQILGESPAEPESDEDFQFEGFPGLDGGAVGSPPPAEAAMAPPPPEQPPAHDGAPTTELGGAESGLASLFDEGPSPQPPPPPTPEAPMADQRPAADLGAADFFQAQTQMTPEEAAASAAPPELSLDPSMAAPSLEPPASAFEPVAQALPPGPDPNAPALQSDVFGPPGTESAGAPAAGAPPGWNPERTVMVQVPEELIAASASSAPTAQPGMDEAYDPGATVVAPISEDMLEAAMAEPADPEEAHFREVYDQFIATRLECGEGTDELTYDRFLIKLRKNRETLIAKYSCRTVRFQVYVKAGKAALKAVPVRD